MRMILAAAMIAGTAGEAAAERIVTAQGATATLVDAGKVPKIIATVKLPGAVEKLAWNGRDPMALLAGGAVGTITPRGFVPIALPPRATWDLPSPGENVTKLKSPLWDIVISPMNELWVGRCDWGGYADGGTYCDDWMYARIGGPKLVAHARPHDISGIGEDWPNVAPPAGISVTFAKLAHEEHDMADDAQQMTCSR